MARAPNPVAKRAKDPSSILAEIGGTGLRQTGGYIDEEFLPSLRGKKAAQAYRQMLDNEAAVGSYMFLILGFLRQVKWSAGNPKRESAAGEKSKMLLETAMHDMRSTWSEVVAQSLYNAIGYGHSDREITWKKCLGPNPPEGLPASKHDDGLWRWKDLAERHPDTVHQWEFDERGQCTALIQCAPPSYRLVRIPYEKIFSFRIFAPKDNPEGRSLLRSAYRAAYFKGKLEDLEAIGYDRDLVGVPDIQVPPEVMAPDADSENARIRTMYEAMAQRLRFNQQAGIVRVCEEIDNRKTGYKVGVIQSSGQRMSPHETILRLKSEILQTMHASVLALGETGGGSLALGKVKQSGLAIAIYAIIDAFKGAFNDQLVPELNQRNGIDDPDDWSLLEPGEIAEENIVEFSTALRTLVEAAVITPTEDIEDEARRRLRLEPKPKEATTPTITADAPSPAAVSPAFPQGVDAAADTALNGAQVTAAKDIVKEVVAGMLPRDTGVAMLVEFFNLPEATADSLVGSAGRGFVPSVPQEQIAVAQKRIAKRLRDLVVAHANINGVFDLAPSRIAKRLSDRLAA